MRLASVGITIRFSKPLETGQRILTENVSMYRALLSAKDERAIMFTITKPTYDIKCAQVLPLNLHLNIYLLAVNSPQLTLTWTQLKRPK